MATISPATLDIGANGQWKGTQGTITADKPIFSSTATWNDAAVTHTHIKSNVTDTASAAASLLLDLQVGGSSKFNVSKAGLGTFAGSLAVNGRVGLQNSAIDAAVGINYSASVTTAVTEYGLKLSLTQAGAGIAYGIQNQVTHSGSISAAAFDNKVTSTAGNRDHIVGVQTVSQHSSTGTMTDLFGVNSSITVSDGCATTNAYHYYATAPTLLGTAGIRVTNLYGLYVADQTSARATNVYAVYTNGTAPSLFGGVVNCVTGAVIGISTSVSSQTLVTQAADGNYQHRFRNAAGTYLGGFYLNGTDSYYDIPLVLSKLVRTGVPTTATAMLRLPHGAAPTAPVDGDVWTTTAGLFVRINGVTKTVTLT